MKELNINININLGGVVSIGLGLLTLGGLSIYYCENGYIPIIKDKGFEFIPVNNRRTKLETIPANT